MVRKEFRVRGSGERLEILTVRLFPIQCSTDVRQERSEHDSPPAAIPGAVGPSLVNRTKNGIDRGIDVWRRSIGCLSTKVWEARNLKAQTNIVWNNLKSLRQPHDPCLKAELLTESNSAKDNMDPLSNEYH